MAKNTTNPPATASALNGEGGHLALEGVLDIRTLREARGALGERMKGRKSATLDIGGLSGLASPGALLPWGLRPKHVELTGVRPEHKALLDLGSSPSLNAL